MNEQTFSTLSRDARSHRYYPSCQKLNWIPFVDQKRGSSKSPEIGSQGGYATNFGANLMGGGGGSSSATPGAGAVVAAGAAGASYGSAGHTARGIEGPIFNYVFKALVTRFVKSMKELKSQENVYLYCDVRQFMSYVKEVHGGAFRRVALSGILDSADRPNKRCNSNVQTTRVIRWARILIFSSLPSSFNCEKYLFRSLCYLDTCTNRI